MICSLPEPLVSGTLELLRLTGVVRAREDEFEVGTKRSRHALSFEPHVLLLENLGLA